MLFLRQFDLQVVPLLRLELVRDELAYLDATPHAITTKIFLGLEMRGDWTALGGGWAREGVRNAMRDQHRDMGIQ